MNHDRGRIPIFVTLVSLAMALVGLFFAYNFFVQPARLMTELDLGDPAIQRAAFMLGTRSLSMALALLLALFLRSRWALITVLSMRAVTELLDMASAPPGPQRDGMLIAVAVMVVAELLSIALLLRSLRKAHD